MYTLPERMKTGAERMKAVPDGMKTAPERVKTVPDRMEIVIENVPTGLTWRGPCRNPGCDHDSGDKLHKRATPQSDFRITHDATRSYDM